jgi:hypothetical protein
MGLEGLDQSDYKLPRIKLLQPLSPEVRSFPGQAIPSQFWHCGANVDLGTQFDFVAAVASKRVILWAPREAGGAMLAYSADGKTWTTGGDQTFDLELKGKKRVSWNTRENVVQSRLLEWGSSDPSDEKSPPAATLIYEYLCYLPTHPDLSPCMLGVYRTAIHNAKKLNTSLLMLRKPLAAVKISCFSDMMQEGGNAWAVPNFKLAGYVQLKDYEVAKEMAAQYTSYTAEYHPDEERGSKAKLASITNDEIPF